MVKNNLREGVTSKDKNKFFAENIAIWQFSGGLAREVILIEETYVTYL